MVDKTDDQLRELERRYEIAEGLSSIQAVLNSHQPLNAVLEYITLSVCRLMSADAVSIYRLQRETQLLTIQFSQGLNAELLAYLTIPNGQAFLRKTVLKGKPVHITNIDNSEEIVTSMPGSNISFPLDILPKQFRSILAVPMVINQETIGATALFYVHQRSFVQKEIDVAVSFCNQAALVIENAQLREKFQEDAVIAERNRIARDLHDSVTQTLFSASLIAEVLPSVWERDKKEASHSLGELRNLTRGALAEMRTLLLELRPIGLTEGRLEDLIKQLAEGISGRIRSPVEVRIEGTAVLSLEVKLVFYRIAQEALNNLAKHSNAEKSIVELRSIPVHKMHERQKSTATSKAYSLSVTLTIRDNGCGFDPRTVTSEHLGLGIMRERAQSVNATISIRSKLGEGTEVSIMWPDPNQKLQI